MSLEEICLKCITHNMERFNEAYLSSSNSSLQLNLKFLQRHYSKQLIRGLAMMNAGTWSHPLEEPYLNFLINEYTKEVSLSDLRDCGWDNVLRRLAEIGHAVVSFACVQEAILAIPQANELGYLDEAITHLPNVENLELPYLCTDQTLKAIATSCPMLKKLNIYYSRVTSEGLQALFSHSDNGVQPKIALRELSLYGVLRIEDGIEYLLRHMPSLEVLKHDHVPYALYHMFLEDCGRNRIGLNDVQKLNLTILSLFNIINVPIVNFMKAVSTVCPDLKDLEIRNQHHLESVSRFLHLEHLEKLYIADERVHGMDVSSLLESIGKGLKMLTVDNYTVDIAILIVCCPNLRSLHLRKVTYRLVQKITANKLNNLSELSFHSLDTGAPMIELLRSSPNLVKVSFQYCHVEDPDEFRAMFCSASKRMQTVTFKHCNLGEAQLQCIMVNCSSLETLRITDCEEIDDGSKESLRNLARALKISIKFLTDSD